MIMKNNNKTLPATIELDGNTLYIKDTLLINNVEEVFRQSMKQLKSFKEPLLTIDIDQLEQIDSIGVATINLLEKKMRARGVSVRLSGGKDSVLKKMDIFSLSESVPTNKENKAGFFESVGHSFYTFINHYAGRFIILMANVLYWSVTDIFQKKNQRKGEFYNQAVLIGINAIWIVAIMAFTIGLVLALQSAAQLRDFGANIYIVDLTVIAMMSEMGPLITAILVAGRSGSSIAAEVATMKVTSELDALKTMGLQPVRFIVVPKMHGSIVTMPFLTVLANIMGIAGGIVIAWLYLDITPQVFINRMIESITNRDLMIGIIKSLVFAFIIVLTGSFFGLNVKQGAEGVGKVTTSAVVASISLVFVADSIMGLIFY